MQWPVPCPWRAMNSGSWMFFIRMSAIHGPHLFMEGRVFAHLKLSLSWLWIRAARLLSFESSDSSSTATEGI